MPELPDIESYIAALRPRIGGAVLQGIRIGNPFLLRTVEPPPGALAGLRVQTLRRIGKRIAIGLEDECWLLLHLMIAGRLHWKPPGAGLPVRHGLAALDFAGGTLILTEAGSKRRAALHLLRGDEALAAHDPGGLELSAITPKQFRAQLTLRNHTLKRALTDPHLFAGIGNAYSDEILHRARLSPVTMSQSLEPAAQNRLFTAAKKTLTDWTARLKSEAGDGFPEKVTAFRPEMAVHGRYGEPCPDCGTAVQRIRHASNETNYCPRCQTDGKVLADRALSRLLRKDWPRTIEELERLKPPR